jgi:uroporphyrinogen III methyltransferase/synthase
MIAGKVFLVGAGPGDPGLITLKGLESLKQADVIVYDHLLDEGLLNLASAKAEKIYAGKQGNKHAKEQDEINRLLVEKALEGKIVVRLKGGDPFVLGRGGEEAEALRNNLIPFEIVPGITSAIAVPAYAGIPVTHRGLASSFAVITGHEDPGKTDSSINWEKISTGIDTLIFLMGMENLDQIAANLIKHGRPAETPVAVIKQGTQSEQQVIVGLLKDIGGKVKERGLGPPAVIVVGEVVRLRENINWFDNRPLFGKRILVTRARHQAGALSRLLAELGAKPIELPVIDIKDLTNYAELDSAISGLIQYNWIIFTSANGVEAFFKRLHNHKLDTRALQGLKIGVIGLATFEALEQKGISPDYLPKVFTTEGLLIGLKNIQISGQRFLLPRADIADKELSTGLIEMGAQVEDIAVYKTGPELGTAAQIKKLFQSGEIDVITFTSSSTVSNLMAALENSAVSMDGVKVACIGPKTADTALKAGLKVDILAEQQTIQGLVDAIEKYFKKETI